MLLLLGKKFAFELIIGLTFAGFNMVVVVVGLVIGNIEVAGLVTGNIEVAGLLTGNIEVADLLLTVWVTRFVVIIFAVVFGFVASIVLVGLVFVKLIVDFAFT